MPIRLSAYITAAYTGRICMKFGIGGFYEKKKSVEEIQILLKPGKNMRHFTWRPEWVLSRYQDNRGGINTKQIWDTLHEDLSGFYHVIRITEEV
jgi:hypothetical protein